MVLLTPGAISAAISSGIVFLFTTALFLSGYVLQQKTVNSLREQIREPPRPTHTYLYLPAKFANPTPEAQPPNQQDIPIINPESISNQLVPETAAEAKILSQNGVEGFSEQGEIMPGGRVVVVEVGAQIPLVQEAVEQKVVAQQDDPARSLDGLSRAERRRRIKEDIEESTRRDREGYHRRTY